METRNEKDTYDMAVPQFKSESCESCFDNAELIDIGRTIQSNGCSIKVSYCVCMECLKELHPVSEMTKKLPGYVPAEERFNKALYFKAYDWINFGQTYK